jgi:hypothetical protein
MLNLPSGKKSGQLSIPAKLEHIERRFGRKSSLKRLEKRRRIELKYVSEPPES